MLTPTPPPTHTTTTTTLARATAVRRACFIHTGFAPHSPTIDGVDFLQAAAAWYAGATPSTSYKLSDTCGALFCNPTCPK
jgi:hypothetical protein